MTAKQYYEAYDTRYRQVHGQNLQWASGIPSAIVRQIMDRFRISTEADILELGCGEARDACALLNQGYQVTATDISPEAIRYCREENPMFSDRFRVLDCVAGEWHGKYDFIYAVAVVHMLVEECHRSSFYRFFGEHLKERGLGLICTMGDGNMDVRSDVSAAFELQERVHGQTGQKLMLAGTSCRMVTWEIFLREIRENALEVLEHGLTAVEPDFPVMMYAVVKKS